MQAESEVNSTLRNHGELIAAMEAGSNHLATKADIESLRSEMRAIRWLIGVGLAIASLLATIISILVNLLQNG